MGCNRSGNPAVCGFFSLVLLMASTGSMMSFAVRRAAGLLALGWMAVGFAQPADVAGTMPEDLVPTLRPILELACRRSPQVMAAAFELEVSGARTEVADAARLPGVSGSFSYATNQTAISSNSSSQSRDNGGFYSFGLTQPVFHWKALQRQSEVARLNQLLARRNYDLAARDLLLLVRRSYLALVVERSRVAQLGDALRILREDVAVLSEKKERGAVAPAVLEGERLRLRAVQLEADRAAAEFDANCRRFGRLVGLERFDPASVPTELPRPGFSPALASAMSSRLLRDGAKSTLEYEIHDLRLRESTLRHQIEKVRLYPKFYLNAGLSLENSTNVNGNAVNQQGIQRRSVSVYAQWSIFDGFATRGILKESLANQRLQERRLALEAEGVLQAVQILERSLQLDAEQAELAEIHHSLALASRQRAEEEVKLGNQPKSDVDRAANAALQAGTRSQESRAAFLSRWSEFVALAGADPILPQTSARHVRTTK
jgi:outer membrane protein TolC